MSDPLPLISIFTVVKNGAKTIRRCVDSVLALDYPNFEHVIQDGASTDGTLEILQEYSRRHPGIVKIVSEPDSCSEEGFFRGFKRCQGEWIGSCLADEALLPNTGKWVVEAFKQHPDAGAVYGDLYITDGNGVIQSEFKAPHAYSVEKYLLHEVNPPFASSFFRREALEDIKFRSYPWAFGMGEFELWVRLGLIYAVHYVPGLVATYAVHPEQLSCNTKVLLELVAARCKYLKRLFTRKDIQKRFGAIYPQTIGGLHLFIAEVLRDSGSYSEAAKLFLKANTFRPVAKHNTRLMQGFYSEGAKLLGAKKYEDALKCWSPLVRIGVNIPDFTRLKNLCKQDEYSVSAPFHSQPTPVVFSALVSVIVNCHNYANHLSCAVSSVLTQTYPNYELLIIDDGSTDDSLKIAQRLAVEHGKRISIRVFHLDDVGPSAARRFGFTQARGRYVVPLDADDKMAPEFLERTVPVLDADPMLGFVYTDTVYFGDTNQRQYQPDYNFKRLCQENFISYCSLVRRAAFEAVDGYDRANWGYFEDWDLWIRLGHAGWFGQHVAEPLFYYHQHFGSSLSFYSLRLAPVYRAYIICHRPQLYPAATVAEAQRILAEMPAGWHTLPPLRDISPVQELLAQHSGNRHLQFFLAHAQARGGQAGAAVATLTELLAGHPGDEQARQARQKFAQELEISSLLARTREFVAQENWAEAAETCAKAVHVAPENTENLFIFAHALANLGLLDDSLKVARRLVGLHASEEFTGLVSALEGALERAKVEGAGEAQAATSADPLRGRRVLVYSDDPGQGGNAHYNHAILLAFVEAGAQASYAQPQGDGSLAAAQAKAGIKHCRTGFNPVVDFGRSVVDEADARRVFSQTQPDLVYFSDCCAFSHIAAKRAAISLKIPFVVICHAEATYLAERFAQYLPVVKEQLTCARAVIAVSQNSLGVMQKYFGLAADKGQVICNGFAEACFAPVDSAVSSKLQAELNIPADAVLCFTAEHLDLARKVLARPVAPLSLAVVSVVIPCYNQSQYLAEAVESVIAQTYPHWEILIVNDGSPDQTTAVAQGLVLQHPDRRIRLIEKANGGLSDARNAGIRHARGDLILPLDADDKIAPTFLAKTVALLEQHPEIAIAYTDYVYFGHQNQRLYTTEYDFRTLCTAYNQFTCTSLYRKAAWVAAGGYNSNMVLGYEDWDFWITCGEQGFTGKRIPEVLFYYRTKENSMVSNARKNHTALFSRIVLNHPRLYAPAMVAQATQILTAAGMLGAGEGHPGGNSKAVSSGDKLALVSICIPTCNGEEFLAATIASAVAQSYPAIEIIISDDASTDRTLEIAGAGVKNSAFPVQILRHERLGLVGNWEHCIRKARGKYIKFLFQDDLLEPDCVASLVEVAERDPAIGLVFSPRRIERRVESTASAALDAAYRDGLDVHKGWTHLKEIQSGSELLRDTKLFQNPINKVGEPTTVLLAKSAIEDVGGFDPNLRQLVDVEMWLRIMTKYKVGFVDRELSCFRLHDKQATQTNLKAGLIAEDWKRFYGKLAMDPIFSNLSAEHRLYANKMFTQLGGIISPSSEEIFGADEVQVYEQLATTYSNNPTEAGVLGQLKQLQQGLMNFLVTARTEELEGQFTGNFGRVFRALVKSGLPSEAPSEETSGQVGVLDEALAGPQDPKKGFDYRPLLARLLCAPAHRGVITITPDRIPAWFLDDYLGYVLHAPQVFVMAGEAEEYRAHLLAWSRAIRQLTRTRPSDPLTNKVAQFFAMRASYIPLYFSNSNTRELAENRAAIMEFVLTRNGAVIDTKFPKRSKPRAKIKVGYVNAHFGAQTETHVTLPSLQLDRSKFEICLFPVATNPGPVEDYCRSVADSFTPLPKELPRQVKTIRDAALDVVIIGTNVTAVTNQVSLIALHRLAPLQLASYCSPVSTGMRHIDGYLTGTLNDYPDLQAHFSEKLYFCEGPPGCLDYTVESPGSGKTFDRASLGLADDDVVFINAAACFKILPEMQATWAKILAAVPKSRLLLLPFNPNWANAFPVKQFERTLTEACARHGVGRERFVLAGSLPSRADVKALERVADVYLDTSPFSGSISVIDPLELGLPLVVQEGATHRSRMASALLRELDLPELITQDEAAYVALAVKLGTDVAYRKKTSIGILEKMAGHPKFINPRAYGQGLSELLESLVAGKPRASAKSAAEKTP